MNAVDQKYFPLRLPYFTEAEKWRRETRLHFCSRRFPELVLRAAEIPAGETTAAGKKILFCSDFHWQGRPEQRALLTRLERIARETAPDLLILGGDLVGDAVDIPMQKELLARLHDLAPEQVAIAGNWECGKRWLPVDFWKDLYASAGIRLLCNESWRDDAFFCGGAAPLNARKVSLPPVSAGETRFPLLLAHSPGEVIAFSALGKTDGYRLALCGHTHGGQWCLPFGWPLYVPGWYGRRFAAGSFRREHSGLQMLVSRGVGELSLPGRFFCPREVFLLSFKHCP